VFILLAEQHINRDLVYWFYSILPQVSAVYFSHHHGGILVHKKSKE